MRLLIVYKLGLVTGDSLLYSDIARNLLNHGTFAQTTPAGIRPTLVRLPGYPFFLAFLFAIFGQDHFRAVMIAQAIIDIGTCLLICDIARRIISEKAARIAFLIASFCPFLANYAATPLAEVPSVFFLTLSVQQAIIALDRLDQSRESYVSGRNWIYCGLALAASILLRPDGGLMLGSIGLVLLYRLWRNPSRRKPLLAGGLAMTVVALAPLVPWAIRNWRVMHVFQPLVTYDATDPGEFVPRGWERWLRTWLIDYSSVEDVAFHMDGELIDIQLVPSRAFDNPEEHEYVASLFSLYDQTKRMTPDLDRRFGELAEQKIRRHPLRYYLELPTLRLLDMWFRPRTELLPFDSHWWTYRLDRWNAIGSCLIGLLNLLLVVPAIAGIFRGEPMRYWALVLVYPIVRSLFLLTTGTAEDRYTVECFPFVFLFAARWFASFESTRMAAPKHALSTRI